MLSKLRNLGPASIKMLAAADIRTLDTLRALGAIRTYAAVQRAGAHPSLNLLWALEGALTDRDWRQIAKEERTRLLLLLDDHQSTGAAGLTSPRSTPASRTGTCLCGAVVFEVNDAPSHLYQCHCSLCRRQGGAAANAAMIVRHEQVRWLSGQDQVSTYRKPSGFRSDFCSTCGSPVPNPVGNTPYTWVPAGLLDPSEGLDIALHLFVGSKAAWEPLPTTGELHDTMPGLQAILAALHTP